MNTAAAKAPGGAARSAARLAAVQALYQMELGEGDVEDVIAEFREHRLSAPAEGGAAADEGHFINVLRGVVEGQAEIDRAIHGALAEGWTFDRIDANLRAILRAGAFEIMARRDVPARVAIAEYVSVAGAFFDDDERKFVNAVLDRLAKRLRADEFNGARR